MSADQTPAIDWDTHEPTGAVHRAAIVLSSADSVDATCYGWVPQARAALAAALDAVDLAGLIREHSEVQAVVPHGEDSTWTCSTCGTEVATCSPSEVDDLIPNHTAAMVRAEILGADS